MVPLSCDYALTYLAGNGANRNGPERQHNVLSPFMNRAAAIFTYIVLVYVGVLVVFAVAGPTQNSIPLHAAGSFVIAGERPSFNIDNLAGSRYGSWNGSDANVGSLSSDAFVLRPIFEISFAGYPFNAGMSAELVATDGSGMFNLRTATMPGQSWTRYTFRMPPAWIGKEVRFRGVDGSRMRDGWMGVADIFTMGRPQWLSRHLAWKALAFIAVLIVIAFACANGFSADDRFAYIVRSPFVYGGALFVALLVFRLPSITSGKLFNPDEAQMTAQGIAFLHHPIPWRDFDGTTSGPINSIVLALPAVIGITPSLGSTRVVAVVALALMLFCSYLFLRVFIPDRIARLTTLLPFSVFCLGSDSSYVSYTSETIPVLFVAGALVCAAIAFERPRWEYPASAMCGLLIGSLIFAKLQAAPFALFLALALPALWWRGQASSFVLLLTSFVAGVLTVPAFILATVAAAGALRDFWIPYIVFPRLYVAGNCCSYAPPQFFFGDPVFRELFLTSIGISGIAIIATIVLAVSRRIDVNCRLFALLCAFAAMLCIGVYMVEAPQTPFYHYLFWLIIPDTVIVGLALGALVSALPESGSRRSMLGLATLLIVVTAAPLLADVLLDKGRSEQFSFRFHAPIDLIAADLQAFIAPGQSVAMWGWMPEYLVYTQGIMGTRDAISQFQIENRPLQNYYRDRYLRDVKRNQPDFVLEAIGPQAFAYKDLRTQGISSFPELASFVASNYRLTYKTDSIRLYRRK